nr:polyhydroxyalkanoate synthesis repressor PhaR [Rhodothalassium salexigens]
MPRAHGCATIPAPAWTRRPKGVKDVTESAKEAPVVIKKYANRRLYNTETSSYVTLDHLARLVKEGREFVVRDAKTGEDLTRAVLTQIIFEQEGKEETLLPVSFLRHLISLYGEGMHTMVPGFLQVSMEGFMRNQEKMRDAVQSSLGANQALAAFDEMTRQNLDLFETAMGMFTPFAAGTKGGGGDPAKRKADLQQRIAALQAELDALDKR